MALPFALPTLASAASTAGNIGSIISAFGGIGKSLGFGNSGPSRKEVFNTGLAEQDKATDRHFERAGVIGKKYNLSRLTVLGHTPQQMSYQAGTDQQPDFNPEALGQNIDRIKQVASSSMERKMSDLALENQTLQNDYLRTQIAGAQKAINHQALPPAQNIYTPAGKSNQSRVEMLSDQQILSKKNDSGKTAGQHPLFKDWDVGGGQTVEAPWSDEGFAESLEGLPLPYRYMKMAEALYKRNIKNTPTGWAQTLNEKLDAKRKAKKEYNKSTNQPWYKY